MLKLIRRWFHRRPADPNMDRINREIDIARAAHKSVGHLYAAKQSLVHDRLRGAAGLRAGR